MSDHRFTGAIRLAPLACGLLCTGGAIHSQTHARASLPGWAPGSDFLPSAPLVTGPTWTSTGTQPEERAGGSVALLGDVNGDGYGDALVGSPGHDGTLVDGGRVALFLGSANGPLVLPAWTFLGTSEGEGIGTAIAAAGDVNGDGYADALVGSAGTTDPGTVRVFFGGASNFPSTASWTATGDQPGSGFGSVLAGAGDTNGDGYSDVLVGAPGFDGALADQGRVHLFLGSASGLAATPAWSVEGEQAGMRLGSSLTPAGDLDGDGLGDLLVGASSFDALLPDAGKVFLFRGAASQPSTIPLWTVEGTQAGEHLGVSLASAGDLNGDGHGDIAVGADGHTGATSAEGAVMVFHGSAQGLAASADRVILGGISGSLFGAALAGAGDVNGDSLGDLLVGAPRFLNNGELSGRVFLYLGLDSGLTETPAWLGQGFDELSGFGQALAGGGDLNGDGHCDLMVGAPRLRQGKLHIGRAYAYLGGAGAPSVTPSTVITEELPNSLIGASLCDAGDVNGDGYSDVLAGAFTYSGTLFEAGKVYLFTGSSNGLESSPAWSFDGYQLGMQLGRSVSSAGDVNGDGYSDLLVGAWSYDGVLRDQGAAFLFFGSELGPASSPSWMVQGDQRDCEFAWSVASAGDVNGDGFGDIIIGTDKYFIGQVMVGAAFLYLGSPSGLSSTPSWTAHSDQHGDGFGVHVASAGDVDGDGYGDVLVDANGYEAQGDASDNYGRLFLFRGGPTGLSAQPSWAKDGIRVADNFGYTAGCAGDVNADGFADIVVGALSRDPCRAYVYHGSASGLSTSASWSFTSDQQNTGLTVSGAGDLNGDGFSDVVLGLYNYTSNLVSQGRTYFVYGSPTGLNSYPAWTSQGTSEEGYFGLDVSQSGDVNGDGYGDVLVGTKSDINVYNGNGGGVAVLTASQRQSDGSPLSLLGRSDRLDGFTITATYRPPQRNFPTTGGIDVHGWLEWEVVTLGGRFDGIPEGRGAQRQILPGSNTFAESVTALFGDMPYAWRARAVTDNPLLPPTAWFSIQGRSSSEPKARIGSRRLRPGRP